MNRDFRVLASANPDDLRLIIPTLTVDEIIALIKCVGETHRVEVTDIDGDTPPNRHPEGEDPFADYLHKKRSELPMGDFTDDELANAIYLNYDVNPSIEDLLSGKGKRPIVYMTAGKERMRWLSRQVIALQSYIATHLPKPVEFDQNEFEVTGEFKSIILKQLYLTPLNEIKLSEPLQSILNKGGGFARGQFWFIGVTTPPEKSRLHTLEGKQDDNSKGTTEGGESQGD